MGRDKSVYEEIKIEVRQIRVPDRLKKELSFELEVEESDVEEFLDDQIFPTSYSSINQDNGTCIINLKTLKSIEKYRPDTFKKVFLLLVIYFYINGNSDFSIRDWYDGTDYTEAEIGELEAFLEKLDAYHFPEYTEIKKVYQSIKLENLDRVRYSELLLLKLSYYFLLKTHLKLHSIAELRNEYNSLCEGDYFNFWIAINEEDEYGMHQEDYNVLENAINACNDDYNNLVLNLNYYSSSVSLFKHFITQYI